MKRAEKLHQAEGLFDAAMTGDIELLKEMKRIRSGQQEVADQFKQVYSSLYTSSSSQEEMLLLKDKIKSLIQTEESASEVMKITPDIVKQAAGFMKPHKMDVSQGFSSDCLLHAPDLLFGLLALIFQDWLSHGTVTRSILACAFIPLLKNSTKDPTVTDSYRAIAGSSIIFKLFETCVLLVWGDQLHSDSLQFGFKKKCRTSTAT